MSQVLQTGPRGGVFYVNSNGNKVYVSSQNKNPRSNQRSPIRSSSSKSSSPRGPRSSPRVNSGSLKPLTPQQERYCRCLKHVEGKKNIYNPYAICAKSVGTTLGRGRHCPK